MPRITPIHSIFVFIRVSLRPEFALGSLIVQRYNVGVPVPTSKGVAHKHDRRAVLASESTGLLLIAFLLLALTLIRYWHLIHWSLR